MLSSTQFEPSSQPSFRSSAVARMVGMPVSTLRIWEQRHQAVDPTTSPSGHRLYSTADVERVMLLRQLTAHGHSIGSLATLGMEQLRKLAVTPAPGEAPTGTAGPPRRAPMRIAVVGQAMARRLQRAAVFRRWATPPQVVGVFDSLADAARAAAGQSTAPVDLLLWQTASLQEATAIPQLTAARDAWSPGAVAVVYRFAGLAARDALVGVGAAMTREPADDEALGAWLWSLESTLFGGFEALGPLKADVGAAEPSGTQPWSPDTLRLTEHAAPPRRFDDATLTDFAGMSSDMACECPSHVAELLMQIASFEAYSADCSHRSPADAELHAYLHRVAGAARVLFEAALERVAIAEGRVLP